MKDFPEFRSSFLTDFCSAFIYRLKSLKKRYQINEFSSTVVDENSELASLFLICKLMEPVTVDLIVRK